MITASHFILAMALALGVEIEGLSVSHEIEAIEIASITDNPRISPNLRDLLSRGVSLAIALESNRTRLETLAQIALAIVEAEQEKSELFNKVITAIENIEFDEENESFFSLESYVRMQNEEREKYLIGIAQKLLELRKIDRALEIEANLERPLLKARLLHDIAKIWIEKGECDRGVEFLKRATNIAKEIEDSGFSNSFCWNRRSERLTEIVLDFARLGQIEAAFNLVREIESCGWVYKNTSNFARSNALLKVLEFTTDRRDLKEAIAIIENDITSPPDRSHALRRIIPKLVEEADIKTVLKMARALEDYSVEGILVKSSSFVELKVVQRRIELRQIKEAIALAEKITDLPSQTSAFFKIARHFYNNKDARAESWLERTLKMSYRLDDPLEQVEVFTEIISIWIEEGKLATASEFLQADSQASLYPQLSPDELSRYKSIELRKVIEHLEDNEQFDLSLRLSGSTDEAIERIERKKIARKIQELMINTETLIEQEQTQPAGKLLRQAAERFSRYYQELTPLQIRGLLSSILRINRKLMLARKVNFADSETKIDLLGIENYNSLISVIFSSKLKAAPEYYKLNLAKDIIVNLDLAGETDRAFEVLELLETGESWEAKFALIKGLKHFFERLEDKSDREISESQKRSYFERALKLNKNFQNSEKEISYAKDIPIALIPLAFEFHQTNRIFSLIKSSNIDPSEKIINLIQNIKDRERLNLIFRTMKIFLNSYKNKSILVGIIPTLQTEEEVELALEFVSFLDDSDGLEILSVSAIRFADFGKMDRAVKLADEIDNPALQALTLARIAVKIGQ